ncbi:hypothetical protein [Thalassiella azotivora]
MTTQPAHENPFDAVGVADPDRLSAGGSNQYGTLPAYYPLEETVAEHPVPDPSGPVGGPDDGGAGAADGDGD